MQVHPKAMVAIAEAVAALSAAAKAEPVSQARRTALSRRRRPRARAC